MSKLSVIIPVYNDPGNLGKCLDALDHSIFEDYQLIVVDDGSDVSCEELAASRCDQFVRLDQNGGQSAARNLGARLATADLLFFLDADIMVKPETLGQVLDEFIIRPEVSALFCSFQSDTLPKNFFSQYKNLQHHFTHQVSCREAATFCGGFGAIRSPVFDELGGFQEGLRFMEDVDLGYRLHQAGHRILLCPAIQLTHTKRYSLPSLVRSDVMQRAIPWTRIMLERRIYRNDLNTSSNNIASVTIVFLMLAALILHPGGAWGLVLVELGFLLTLVFLNRQFLVFVRKARGNYFALRAVAMVWFQYAYSGLGLVLGVLAYFRDRIRGNRHD
jgi:glycosyltransferase involved in cell wall biosynthesis